MGESDDKLTKVSNGKGDMFDRVIKAIKEVGVPTVALAAFIAYFWFVGVKTNEHLSQGTKVIERAVSVLERLEKKLP